MEPDKEILAAQIEIHNPIEIINPRATRYTAPSKQFSKIYWDASFSTWIAVSRATGHRGLIGAANVKGVRFADAAESPEKFPVEQKRRGRPAKSEVIT